jgi:hypothetical protein
MNDKICIKPVHLPDCFLNVTNRLVAMEYYDQIKQFIPAETINLMVEHIKRILDESRGFRVTVLDKIKFFGIQYKSKRHKFIRIQFRDSIRLLSYLIFRDFYNDFAKINLSHGTSVFTFPIDKLRLITEHNNEHPRRTTEFIQIYKKLLNDLDKISADYIKTEGSFVRVNIPNNPKINQLEEVTEKYKKLTKNIRKYLRVFENLVHQEIQDLCIIE